MPTYGFGFTYGEDDLEIVNELAREFGVDTFEFPENPEAVRRALGDDKLNSKFKQLSDNRDVTLFALLIAAAMLVGADIPAQHRALLNVWLSSDIKGDLHPAGCTALKQALKIYKDGKPLDLVGMGQTALIAQANTDPNKKPHEAYFYSPSGDMRPASKSDYPIPTRGSSYFGCGRWDYGLIQSDLEMDVLDIFQPRFGIKQLYGAENDEDIRTKLEKADGLNKLLDELANDESVPDGIKQRKREAKQYCFAVMVTAAMINGVKISDENKARIKEYLEESQCGLGPQGWLDLRHAVRTYQDGFYLPLLGEGLRSTIGRLQREERLYQLAKAK